MNRVLKLPGKARAKNREYSSRIEFRPAWYRVRRTVNVGCEYRVRAAVSLCLAASQSLCALPIWKSLIRLSWPLSGWLWYWPRHLYCFGVLNRMASTSQQNALTAEAHVWRVWMEFNTVLCRHTFERSPCVCVCGNDNGVHFEHIVVDARARICNHCVSTAAFFIQPPPLAILIYSLFTKPSQLFSYLLFARQRCPNTIQYMEKEKNNIWNGVACSSNNKKQ